MIQEHHMFEPRHTSIKRPTPILAALSAMGMLSLTVPCAAQWPDPTSLVWQRAIGGSASDVATALAPGPLDGWYISMSSGSTDGDLAGVTCDDEAIIVMRLDALGAPQWSACFEPGTSGGARSLSRASDNGVYLATNSDEFGTGTAEHYGFRDFWVTKLNTSGAQQWESAFGGSDRDEVLTVEGTSDGGAVLAGFTDSSDGLVTGTHGARDGWVVKVGPSGVMEWQRTLGGPSDEEVNAIVQTADGGYLAAGFTRSTSGDVGTPLGENDGWLVKLNADGSVAWAINHGSALSEEFLDIKPWGSNEWVLSGYRLHDTGNEFYEYDAWYERIDASGNVLAWGLIGTEAPGALENSNDQGDHIAPLNNGTVVISGANSTGEWWFAGLDAATGDALWGAFYGGTGFLDTVKGLRPTSSGTGVVAAGFVDVSDQDVTGGHGGNEAWILELDIGEVGFPEPVAPARLRLAPVPATDVLRVLDTAVSKGTPYRICDGLGSVVAEGVFTALPAIPVAELAPGPYSLALFDGSRITAVGRFIVAR